jgi:ABC-2 type transport system ATP-binding protein
MTTTTPCVQQAEKKLSRCAIRVDRLSHRYPEPKRSRRGEKKPVARPLALDGLTFQINEGEIFGILGPNGGGKTTLSKILSTMLQPTAGDNQSPGSATIMGYDVFAEPGLVRRQLGVVFQSPSLDGKLTAKENLVHQGRLYGLTGGELKTRIAHWLDYFGLADRADEYVERFSGGMRRRLEVAKALLHEPKLLLMDEPATGLDPAARRDLWQKLLQLRDDKGMTIALTTHLMDEAERCDRLAILAGGKLVAVDTPMNLKARIGGDVITIEPETGQDGHDAEALAGAITEKFGPWDDSQSPTACDGVVRLEKPEGARVVAEIAAAFPGCIRSITVGRPTIEDVFLHLTGASLSREDE